MSRPWVIYLSSSAHSDWRDAVKERYDGDPRVRLVGPCEEHGLSDAMGAPGDVRPGHKLRIMQMLSKSDLLFGYIPNDRYRSFNIFLEIGIAQAWGRRILFVNEAPSLVEEARPAAPFVDETFDALDAGLARMEALLDEDPPKALEMPDVRELLQPTGEVVHRVALSGSPDPEWIETVEARYREDANVEIVVEPDFAALTRSDILLACRTSAEGRLFNLCLAVGVAAALGKRILFVNVGDHYSHAYDYIKPFADGNFGSLDEALRYLDYAVGIEHRL